MRNQAIDLDAAKKKNIIVSGTDINVTQTLLFGSVEGIASGTKENKGYFEQADGGILFLDEIGDISIPAQRLLIEALVTKKYKPLGAEQEKQSDYWGRGYKGRIDGYPVS